MSNRKQDKPTKKLVKWIVSILVILIAVVGISTFVYVNQSLQPYNVSDQSKKTVNIPEGATNRDAAIILEKSGLIKNSTIFTYWAKFNHYDGFKAGDYSLSPSMTLSDIVNSLQNGLNKATEGQIVIKEGDDIDDIATSFDKNGKFKKQDFLDLVNNKDFIKKLAEKYPNLLNGLIDRNNLRYLLEGYLYPASYDIFSYSKLEDIVTTMVDKTNQEMTPFYDQIKSQNKTVHDVLTLASLVEKEGVSDNDRAKIAGVFDNRLDQGMTLGTDISVLYALNQHKTMLSIDDTKVDSPYNLYQNKGIGPGPFAMPSESSIKAVLNPADRDQSYLYFVADLKTGKVYYSKTYDEHIATNTSLGQQN
ncbi:endolytic transglycosylase MltG [Holzapfeliella floricola]|uniref:Endolytic murein transglycosylase n=1 Tax=Holzapfeliella floricola DSM 23037 = JCM 16512 TaxID=1423744 RepID=A0A0R2DIF5_9LACO|nr:endolytic transglycosylase MltG [Holzapfeliella floricola]KRN03880.1 hypothetical protein FC86_GL000992 [Holzapfeliella floricola DSM 23037 = JCM 16512]